MKNLKIYFWAIASALLTGGIAAFITRGNMDLTGTTNMPPLSPPMWLFPIVWSILYVLMGIGVARYFINTQSISKFYILQLIVNFIWPIVFFNLRNFLLAFILLVVLLVLVILMSKQFYKVDKVAGLLQIPYVVWLLFAGYLNFAIYLLN